MRSSRVNIRNVSASSSGAFRAPPIAATCARHATRPMKAFRQPANADTHRVTRVTDRPSPCAVLYCPVAKLSWPGKIDVGVARPNVAECDGYAKISTLKVTCLRS